MEKINYLLNSEELTIYGDQTLPFSDNSYRRQIVPRLEFLLFDDDENFDELQFCWSASSVKTIIDRKTIEREKFRHARKNSERERERENERF